MTDPGYGQGQPYGQGQQYGAGQGTPYPAPSGMPFPSQATPDAKGFMASLFDTSFNFFVTPKIIKIVYVIVMIIVGIETLGWILYGFIQFKALGIVFLPIALLVGLVALAIWRMTFEVVMVLFRMGDDMHALRGNR